MRFGALLHILSHIFCSNQPILMHFFFCFIAYYVVNFVFWEGKGKKSPANREYGIAFKYGKVPPLHLSISSAANLLTRPSVAFQLFVSSICTLSVAICFAASQSVFQCTVIAF